MSKDEEGGVSSDTIEYLEDVKKGKPRKFAMICKGANIVSLVVYKKGNVESRKKEAKESGRGQFYFGVVNGKGQDIRFVLSRADGFTSAPVKTMVLKNFLDESAQLKCKPLFEIVDAAPLVFNEDDPIVKRFLALQTVALQVCDARPEEAGKINELCLKIGKALDQEQSEQATVDLELLESLLGNPSANVSAQASEAEPAAPAETAGDKSALAVKLRAALDKLRVATDQVIQSVPNSQTELKAALARIEQALESNQLEQAQAELLALGKQLKTITAAKTSEANSFAERQRQLEPLLLQAQRASQEKSVALGNVWQHALKQAAAGNFVVASKAFDKLEEAVQAILNPASGQDKWLGWQASREEVVKQIKQVATAVAATKDPDARGVIIELQSIIKNISLKPEGGQAIEELKRFLNDDLITAAEEVPAQFGSLQIRQPLLQALSALEA